MALTMCPVPLADELRAPSRRFPPVDSSSFPFFVVESPKDLIRVEQLEKQLDRGEAAAIALAIEKNADRLLIDEHDGRMMAESLGLSVVGVLGFLLEAKKQSLVPAVCPLIERLQKEIGFHLSPRLVARVIQPAKSDIRRSPQPPWWINGTHPPAPPHPRLRRSKTPPRACPFFWGGVMMA